MKNKLLYETIIREKLGNEYIYDSENIKDEQCKYCSKRVSVRCRLNIRDKKCINYKEK